MEINKDILPKENNGCKDIYSRYDCLMNYSVTRMATLSMLNTLKKDT